VESRDLLICFAQNQQEDPGPEGEVVVVVEAVAKENETMGARENEIREVIGIEDEVENESHGPLAVYACAKESRRTICTFL
jgi:hypothetical protein